MVTAPYEFNELPVVPEFKNDPRTHDMAIAHICVAFVKEWQLRPIRFTAFKRWETS
jgi:hypothetical protein